jgi:hypothetical protein
MRKVVAIDGLPFINIKELLVWLLQNERPNIEVFIYPLPGDSLDAVTDATWYGRGHNWLHHFNKTTCDTNQDLVALNSPFSILIQSTIEHMLQSYGLGTGLTKTYTRDMTHSLAKFLREARLIYDDIYNTMSTRSRACGVIFVVPNNFSHYKTLLSRQRVELTNYQQNLLWYQYEFYTILKSQYPALVTINRIDCRQTYSSLVDPSEISPFLFTHKESAANALGAVGTSKTVPWIYARPDNTPSLPFDVNSDLTVVWGSHYKPKAIPSSRETFCHPQDENCLDDNYHVLLIETLFSEEDEMTFRNMLEKYVPKALLVVWDNTNDAFFPVWVEKAQSKWHTTSDYQILIILKSPAGNIPLDSVKQTKLDWDNLCNMMYSSLEIIHVQTHVLTIRTVRPISRFNQADDELFGYFPDNRVLGFDIMTDHLRDGLTHYHTEIDKRAGGVAKVRSHLDRKFRSIILPKPNLTVDEMMYNLYPIFHRLMVSFN